MLVNTYLQKEGYFEFKNNKEIKEIIKILTAKLKDRIINCYDGKLNKETLKKWTSKNIILCPICNKPYEYCHGEFKNPYFRHKEKSVCEYKYSESETQEHIQGKQDLYKWIKSQIGVTDAFLEGWIPETKQRPDIMFKINGMQYIIEYQCTPIATEYHERHQLYKESGIIDIWILGYEKYKNLYTSKDKVIEKFAVGYYNTELKHFYINFKNVDDLRKYDIPFSKQIVKFGDIVLQSFKNNLDISKVTIQKIFQMRNIYEELNIRRQINKEDQKRKEQFIISKYGSIAESLNISNFISEFNYKFTFYKKTNSYYISKFFCEIEDVGKFAIFIKNNCFDICIYTYGYENLKSVEYDNYNIKFFENEIKSFFLEYLKNRNLEE